MIEKQEIEKVKKLIKTKKENYLSEKQISRSCNITPSQVRYAIAELRYIMPIIKNDKGYKYTTKDKEQLQKYKNKLESQIKQKCIKKNLLAKYI